MSYILQALEKSEQERHRGEVPDLQRVSTPAYTARRRPASWALLVGGLLAVNLGALLIWMQPWSSPPPATPTAQAGAAIDPSRLRIPEGEPLVQDGSRFGSATGVATLATRPVQPSEQPEGSAQDPGASRVQQAMAQDDGQEEQPEAHGKGPEQTVASEGPGSGPAAGAAGTPHPAGSKAPSAPSGPAKVAQRSSQPRPAGPDAPHSGPQSTQAASDTPPSGGTTARTRSRGPEPEPASPAEVQPPSQATLHRADGPDVPSLRALPEAMRKALPEIHISVHLYDNKPRRRKARINGRMLQEGEEVAPGLRLDRITRSGVVLRYRDRSFYMQVI